MIRPALLHHLVGGRDAEIALRELLEERFVIRPLRPARHLCDLRIHPPAHEPAGRLDPAVEVDRRDDRLEEIGKDRHRDGAVDRQPLADDEKLGEAEMLANPATRLAAHHHRLDARQISLERFRKDPVEGVADDEAENRVSEKLEPLVRGEAMGSPRSVRQGGKKDRFVAEGVADPLLAGDQIDWAWPPGRKRHRLTSAQLTSAQKGRVGRGR